MTIATAERRPSVLDDRVSIRKSERTWSLLGCAFFILLAWWQIAHHAMWRDELQAWEIAVANRSPWDLFGALHYEGHPGLWYLLLWLATFVTTDPHAMQGIQGLVAAGLVSSVWLLMPFRSVQKLLISCSYFLVFEYTVMSRSYGLGVLLTFLAMGCWQSSSKEPSFVRGLLPWALLGLAANTSFYNAMLAGVLAGWRLWTVRPAERWNAEMAGLVLFGVLLAAAMLAMQPAEDVIKATTHGGDWSAIRVLDVEVQTLRTFLPINSEPWIKFWEPLPFDKPWPYLILTVPLLWLLARALGNTGPAMPAILAVVAGTAFTTLAVYPAAVRHTGVIFILFLLMAWDCRSRDRLNAEFFVVILTLNAAGGLVATAGSQARPFSQAESVAAWFRGNDLDQAFIAATAIPYASAVSGYLRRPLYYPDCDCMGTYTVWRRDPRVALLIEQPLGPRLVKAMDERHLERLYLVTVKIPESDRLPVEDPASLDLSVIRVASFDGASDTLENYDIFRVDRAEPRS